MLRIVGFFRMAGLALAVSLPGGARTNLEALLRPAHRVYTAKDGLPQNTIQASAMEPGTGRLWVATQDGLAHFNGHRWQSVSLPNRQVANFVRTLAFDEAGSLWAGTNGDGLFRRRNERWEAFLANGQFPAQRVNTVLPEPGGDRVWIGTHGEGLWEFRQGAFAPVPLPASGGGIVWTLHRGPWEGHSRLWAGLEGALVYREADQWHQLPLPQELANVSINSLCEDPDGQGLWIGTWGKGVWRWRAGAWQQFSRRQGLPDDLVTSLTSTAGSGTHPRTLWAGTLSGLARWNGPSWQPVGRPGEAFQRPVYSLLPTRWNAGAESLWIGTRGGGLARMDLGRWQRLDDSSGLPSGEIRAVLATKGTQGEPVLWVGAERGGLIQIGDEGLHLHALPGGAQGIHSLLPVRDAGGASIWVGTRTNGVFRWRGGAWEEVPGLGQSNLDVLSLAEVAWEPGRTRIFAGTNRGLYWHDQDGWHPDLRKPLGGTFIQSLHVSPQDPRRLWVGTRSQGLARLDAQSLALFGAAEGLPNPWVRDISSRSAAGSRELWIATAGGLAILDEATGIIRTSESLIILDPTEGLGETPRSHLGVELPSLVVNQVEFDGKGRAYLMTTRGLVRLDPRGGQTWIKDTYTEEDGLPEGEGVPGAACVDARGRIWIGTTAGLAMLDLSRELRDHSAKPLSLEAIEAGGRPLAPAADQTYSHRFKDWTFEAALVGFTRQDRTQYRFQLEGYESTPSAWSSESRRSYTNLDPGRYRLHVWAVDGWGNPSLPLRWDFRIRSAPWATWWALGLEGLALASLILGVFRWRLGLLRVHNRELERAVETRTEELADARDAAIAASRHKTDFLAVMSHEVRTPLNGILGMSNLLTDTSLDPVQREYVEAIRISNHHLSALINDVLDLSKIEADRLDLDIVAFDLVRELEEVAFPMASVARAKGLEFVCDLPGDLPAQVMGDPTRLRQVLLNLLGNAVKFTRQGQVVLRGEVLQAAPFRLRLEVQDSGRGIPPELQGRIFEPFRQADASTSREFGGTGLGLAISRRLVEKMGGTIAFRSQVDVGTTFHLELDLQEVARSLPMLAEGPLLLLMGQARSRQALLRLLQSWNLEVRVAGTPEELLALSRACGTAGARGCLIDAEALAGDPAAFAGELAAAGPVGFLATVDALSRLSPGAIEGRFQVLTNPWRQGALRAFLLGQAFDPTHPAVQRAQFQGRVLVVDDHPINRRVMHAMLEKLGLVCEEVAGGQEALDRLQEGSFDLVLMDCEMPVMDGFEATRTLRRSSATPPVVALTAHVLEGTREKCLEAGMDDYLSKPVKPEALGAALRRWLPAGNAEPEG